MPSARGKRDEVAAVSADELRQQLTLKKMVGKGGFAAVFLGTYQGQEVAVKVILAEHVTPESVQVKLLLREGQYMSRCTHKNIVKCHCVCQLPADFPGIEGLGHRGSTWALVLEYIGGGSIASLLMRQMAQTRRAYSDYEAYCWVRDVAEALCYLHNAPRPVMHRDVKADNVLITTDPDTGRPTAKLMDFGLMAALDGAKNPMLRRRSMSPGDALARSSARLGGGAGGGGGGLGRGSVGPSLAAPSVATYYNDATHEPGKIFYLLDELPAVTVASVPLPGGSNASRRPSLDGAAAAAAAAAAASGAAAHNTTFGFTAVSSRHASFNAASDNATAAAAGSTAAAVGVPWSGGGGAGGGGKPPPVRSPYGSNSGMLPSIGAPPPGGLVPLSEEASYHGNTAGYAAMLQAQQQARRAAAEARAAAAAAAPPPPPHSAGAHQSASLHGNSGHGNGHAAGGGGRGMSSSLPNSMHGHGGMSAVAGTSPYDSPAGSGRWRADEVAAGAVKLRVLDDTPSGNVDSPVSAPPRERHPYHLQPLNHPASAPTAGHAHNHAAAAGSGGDAAIAAAAEAEAVRLLGPHATATATGPSTSAAVAVAGRDGSLVRMSVQSAAPPARAGGEVSSDSSRVDDTELLIRDSSTQPVQQHATEGGHPEASTPQTCVPRRPSLLSAAAAAAVAAASPSAAAPIVAVARQNDTAAAGIAASASPISPANYHLTSSRPPSSHRVSHDAVPVVDVGSSGGGAAAAAIGGASALGHRSRLGGGPGGVAAAITVTSSRPPSAPSSGVHTHMQAGAIGRTSAAVPGTAAGGGGGALATSQPELLRSSFKSGGSNRSAAGAHGNGHAHAAPDVTSLLQGRYEQDFQWVWRLTGQTGSCMYMAPEVYRNMPYNEKVDVFSFGVLLYEVFSRTLTLIAGLNLRDLRLKGMDNPEGYAAYVADGYRPARPQSMPEPLYELISACWADDPCARPAMADVVDSLAALQEAYAPHPKAGGAGVPACGCVVS